MKDLEFRRHARAKNMFVAETVTGDQCAVGTTTKGVWYYRIGNEYFPCYDTAAKAQEACNAKHKRLILDWIE